MLGEDIVVRDELHQKSLCTGVKLDLNNQMLACSLSLLI